MIFNELNNIFISKFKDWKLEYVETDYYNEDYEYYYRYEISNNNEHIIFKLYVNHDELEDVFLEKKIINGSVILYKYCQNNIKNPNIFSLQVYDDYITMFKFIHNIVSKNIYDYISV